MYSLSHGEGLCFFFLILRGVIWSRIDRQILLKELAKASGHCYCMGHEVKILEKASQNLLVELAVKTRQDSDTKLMHGRE